jgi:4-amino-4-deoxy-L-arabinose transferase-like glycosyltransferase
VQSGCLWCSFSSRRTTLFSGLGRYPLWEPDEARHAEIAREMGEHANWILPTLYGRPYHHKPVLYYWLTAGAFAVGGRGTATARVVSGLAGVLVLIAVFAWARDAWGSAGGGLLNLTLLTTIEFVALGRYGDLNMLLTLWVTWGSSQCIAGPRMTDEASGSFSPPFPADLVR